ncbi:MAG: hypothetical protein MZV64_33940 [Ignavibacteriales bacterium]|nr:hypothetical protein [Ignavibacteriales bacterium]
MAQKQFDKVADILDLDQRDPRPPAASRCASTTSPSPSAWTTGSVKVFRGFRVPAQRRPRPLQGRHPLPPAGDDRHRPGPGHVDDLEVRRRRHPARRRQGRRHLRPARPQPRASRSGSAAAGSAPGRQERRPPAATSPPPTS